MSREPLTPAEQPFAQRLRAWPAGEPSPQLDARILADARAAVAKRPKRRPALVGFASAAALVLTVGVAWRVGQEPAQDVLMQAPLPEMRSAEPLRGDRDEGIAPQPAAPAAGVIEPLESERPAGRMLDDARDGLGSSAATAPLQDVVQPAPPTDAAAAGREDRRQSAPAERLERRRDAPAAPPVPASAPRPPPAFVPEPPPPAERAAPEPDPATSTSESALVLDRQDAGDARRLRLGTPAPAATGEAKAQSDTGFDAAVAQIRDLLDRGDVDAALAAIARLRKDFSRHEIPPDLLRAERDAADR